MKIRFKVMALVALLFALLISAAIIIEQRVVMPSFARLERAVGRSKLSTRMALR